MRHASLWRQVSSTFAMLKRQVDSVIRKYPRLASIHSGVKKKVREEVEILSSNGER